jgi:hypothetical protein
LTLSAQLMVSCLEEAAQRLAEGSRTMSPPTTSESKPKRA